jgi:hypothetical protein
MGVNFKEFEKPKYPTLFIIDEAQALYEFAKGSKLEYFWNRVKILQNTDASNAFILLVSSYGPGSILTHLGTPVQFTSSDYMTLEPTGTIGANTVVRIPGLKLTNDEVIELINSFITIFKMAITKEAAEWISLSTNNHVGLLICILF